jgi:hypothetical protein
VNRGARRDSPAACKRIVRFESGRGQVR